ncbi:RNA-guided endonuclease InsQ/TnpB family protein [Colwellia sp. PAMC 20917]|uniref:RNA-guided endonuclease InsQ/TnpB family protein n=1 Tax=Colwellia sp. PAMC 20917 TaxID=1816218 RepID=UPI0009F16D6E|nr:RNA-guided endonuclease TnpB family protein [Colwellia sp. PAMC 20917]
MSLISVSKFNIGQTTPLQTELRRESARLWNDMVKLHKFIRKRRWKWPFRGDFEKHFKSKYRLHSQTNQALIKKFFANIETTSENRKAGDKKARYPYRDRKHFQVVMYKASAIKRKGNRVILSNGLGVKKLIVRIPKDIPIGKITGAELSFRELRLTIKQDIKTIKSAGSNVVAADLGVIHLAAMTDGETSEIIVGRGLRSLIQYRNKKLAEFSRLLSKCKKGSRRSRKLRVAKAKMLFRNDNQQRNLLHHASKQMIDYCVKQQAGMLVVGDCINMSKNARKKKKGSRRSNQMNSNNPLGQLLTYLKYKGKFQGVELDKIGEQYTTQTCPKCGHRHKPSGRNYQCKNPECDFIGVRDLVGSANIKNKFENGRIEKGYLLPPLVAKYRRPVKVPVIRLNCVVHLTDGMLLDNTLDAAQALSSAGGKTPSELFHVA